MEFYRIFSILVANYLINSNIWILVPVLSRVIVFIHIVAKILTLKKQENIDKYPLSLKLTKKTLIFERKPIWDLTLPRNYLLYPKSNNPWKRTIFEIQQIFKYYQKTADFLENTQFMWKIAFSWKIAFFGLLKRTPLRL